MADNASSDAELLDRARAGDHSAFSRLYERHRAAAVRLARSYGAQSDAEDLVSEAFERVMAVVARGAGPRDALRPYLYVTIRHLAMARRPRAHHEPLDAVPEAVVAVADLPAMDPADRQMIAAAFSDLPERWQAVLWQTAVEGRRPREVARAVGLPANTVAVVAHRARERLRQGYLQAHVGKAATDRCRPHQERLGAYVRGGLTRRQRAAADEHVAACESCGRLVAELDDVNRLLARAVLPVFAVGATEGLTAGSAGMGGAAGSAVPTTGGGAASGMAAAGASAGAGTGIGVTTAAVLAAVVALVALAPSGSVASDSDAATVQAVGAAAPAEQGATTTTSAPVAAAPDVTPAPAPPPSEAPATGLPAGAGDAGTDPMPPGTTAPGLDVGADVVLDLDGLVPDLRAEAEVDLGVDLGVDGRVTVDGTWTVGPLGTGTLALVVANPRATTLADAEVLVELSPGAQVTTLLGSGCDGTGTAVLDGALSALRSLTCGLEDVAAHDTASVTLPLTVVGPGQTATIRVQAGSQVLATTAVPLGL
jgi:RNA polymerase sigma factor (sigma-70 family)